MVSNWTLAAVLTTGLILYLVLAIGGIIVGSVKAYKGQSNGLKAIAAANTKSGAKTRPHPQFAGRRMTDEEFAAYNRDEYREINCEQHKPLLWLHIALPPFIGIVLGFILTSVGFFTGWVTNMMGDTPGTFVGLLELVLCVIVIIGLIMALLIPFKLYSKMDYSYRDYVWCVWAAFAVSLAFIAIHP